MSPPLELDYIGLSAAAGGRPDDDLKGTELRLGLPGCESPDRRPVAATTTLDLLPAKGAKRGFSDEVVPPAPVSAAGKDKDASGDEKDKKVAAPPQPAAKAQVVGWPPVRSYRKSTMATTTNQLKSSKEDSDTKQGQEFLYVKVSMDGAPYLRKVDLKTYKNYKGMVVGLGKMFIGFRTGEAAWILGKDGEYVMTYEDKDGDWMLVGDVPWDITFEGQPGACSSRLRRVRGRVQPLWVYCTQPF
uniref:Auxin-responsive protein n=1 Tax=Aegilops tauschii subsp. strangulata TaxID=200361 RepID=A0A453EI65_AEGTS